MKSLYAKIVLSGIIVWSIVAYTGCKSAQVVQATIVDSSDKPIPNALLYYEAYTHDGAFDFGFSLSGETGEVPPAGNKELNIFWRPGAKIAFAAFATGKKATVLYDYLGYISPVGMKIKLDDLPGKGKRWEPRIAKLSFPFEDNSELAVKAAAPEAVILRSAFQQAYAPLISGKETALGAERVKIEALFRLEKTSSSQ